MRRNIKSSKIEERRKKRMLIPMVYFMLEIIFVWLVLSLIQLKFDPRDWAIWSIGIFMILGAYSLSKTLHVYNRQKNYKE